MRIADTVDALIRETVERMGYELDEVEFAKEQDNWMLVVYIDKPGGVSLEDCEAVSRAIDPILDSEDPIEQSYFLSVSSIGLERPLKKDKDFVRNMGKRIIVKLYAPIGGKKEMEGVLSAFDAQTLTLQMKEEPLVIERKGCASVKPYVDFSGMAQQGQN